MSKRTKIDDESATGFERGTQQPNGGPVTVKVPRHKLPPDHPAYESLAAKFRRLANKRVPAAVKRISHVKNMFNRSQYQWTDEEAKKILAAVWEATVALDMAIKGTKEGKQQWSL